MTPFGSAPGMEINSLWKGSREEIGFRAGLGCLPGNYGRVNFFTASRRRDLIGAARGMSPSGRLASRLMPAGSHKGIFTTEPQLFEGQVYHETWN